MSKFQLLVVGTDWKYEIIDVRILRPTFQLDTNDIRAQITANISNCIIKKITHKNAIQFNKSCLHHHKKFDCASLVEQLSSNTVVRAWSPLDEAGVPRSNSTEEQNGI